MISGLSREADGNTARWAITQQEVVILYRRFGKAYRTHPQWSRIQDP